MSKTSYAENSAAKENPDDTTAKQVENQTAEKSIRSRVFCRSKNKGRAWRLF